MRGMSKRAWNNVIIFAMLAMIVVLNLDKFKNTDDDNALITLVDENDVILSAQFSGTTVERIGTGWRASNDNRVLDISSDALADTMMFWKQALAAKSTDIDQGELSRYNPSVVVIWIAGEREGRVFEFYDKPNNTYIRYNDNIYLLSFPTLKQLLLIHPNVSIKP